MSVAKSDRFLVDGVNLAGYLKSFAPSAQTEELDATVLSSTYRAYESGFKSGQISAEGIFAADSTTADKIHDVFAAAISDESARVVTAGIGFYSIGSEAFLMDGCAVKYDIPTVLGQLILANADFRSTNGMSFGVWLTSAQYDAGTNNGTAVDGGVATTNGGLFHVHLHNDDASDVDVKVQHSTTGVGAWVDLASVNNLSADYDSGSAVVAKGTTVNRYLRAVATITGGNTILVSAAFARRY